MYDDARESFEMAIIQSPNIVDFHYEMSSIEQRLFYNYELAVQQLEQCIELNPYDFNFYNSLGNIYEEIEDLEAA